MALVIWPGAFALDDTYITLTNARTLLGIAPDPFGTSYLVGATSAVHLSLVTAFGLILPLEAAAFAVGLVSIILYAMGLDRLADRAGLEGWRAAAIPVIGLLWGLTLIQLMNGLETGLAMATVTWMLVLADNRRWLPILSGLSFFIRPELILLAFPLFVRLAWRERTLGPWLIAFAAFAPWALWYYIQTGVPIPTTGTAKVDFFAESQLPLPTKLAVLTKSLLVGFMIPLLLGFVGYWRLTAGWCAAFFVAGWIILAAVTIPGSLHWNDSRYAATLIPALLYGICGLVSDRTRSADVLLGLFTAGALATGTVAFQRWLTEIPDIEQSRRYGQAIAALPSSAIVIVHDAGWAGWLRPKAKLVDAVGLKTASSRQWHKAYTRRACGWDRALDAIAKANHATHLAALNDIGFWRCVRTNIERAGWTARPVLGEPNAYGLYELSPPKGKLGLRRAGGR